MSVDIINPLTYLTNLLAHLLENSKKHSYLYIVKDFKLEGGLNQNLELSLYLEIENVNQTNRSNVNQKSKPIYMDIIYNISDNTLQVIVDKITEERELLISVEETKEKELFEKMISLIN